MSGGGTSNTKPKSGPLTPEDHTSQDIHSEMEEDSKSDQECLEEDHSTLLKREATGGDTNSESETMHHGIADNGGSSTGEPRPLECGLTESKLSLTNMDRDAINQEMPTLDHSEEKLLKN